MKAFALLLSAVFVFGIFEFNISGRFAAYADESKPTAFICREVSTDTVISGENENQPLKIGHLTKIMTALCAYEQLQQKKMDIDSRVSVSKNANSQTGTQIWLNVGEQVSIRELIFAITVSNANDAAVALAEAISGSEDKFVGLMNERAAQLGMKNTSFSDCTGNSPENVSSAYDLSLLAQEFIKYKTLTDCACTWLTDVRAGQTQLVNTDRLVRYYNGLLGIKTCAGDNSGGCAVNAAVKGDMTAISVVLGKPDLDAALEQSENLLDSLLGGFEIYTPEIPGEAFESITVENGVNQTVGIAVSGNMKILIPKGKSSGADYEITKVEKVQAPVLKGQKLGEIVFFFEDKEVCRVSLDACKAVEKMNFFIGFKRMFFSMIA